MRLSRIRKALKRRTLVIVTEAGGNQWLGDGVAFYLVDSGLDLTEDNVKSILDIDEDKRDEYTARETDDRRLPMCDMCPQEGCDDELQPLVSLSWAGELVTIMRTNGGWAVAVPQGRIEPADGKGPLRFFLRTSVDPETGEYRAPVVACFQDMLCCAVITPVKAEAMDEIWRIMRMASAESLKYCLAHDGDKEEGA